MSKKTFDVNKNIRHWLESSEQDFCTMENLIKSKDYHWALFIGHLVIEKLLKAYYVKTNKTQAVPVHNLLLLAKKAELEVPERYEELLDTITTFNISARYDSDTNEFYNLCTKEFTEEWKNKIMDLREWIKLQLEK